MSVTLLRASDNNDFYYLDNETFEYKWGYTDSDYDYQYDCYFRNTNFIIGNSMFRVRPIMSSNLAIHLDIETPNTANQITIAIESTQDRFDRNLPELYFKPVNGVLKIPRKDYYTVAVSEYPFKASLAFNNGHSVYANPFSILIFNKNLEFVGSTIYCDLTCRLSLGLSLDSKLSTLCKFNDTHEVVELLLKRQRYI